MWMLKMSAIQQPNKSLAGVTTQRMFNIAMVSDFFYPNMGGVESHLYQVWSIAKLKCFKMLQNLLHRYFAAFPMPDWEGAQGCDSDPCLRWPYWPEVHGKWPQSLLPSHNPILPKQHSTNHCGIPPTVEVSGTQTRKDKTLLSIKHRFDFLQPRSG